MSSGVPVVASPVACQGIGAIEGRELIVAESADAFADSLLQVIADPAARRRLAESGRQYVERHHDWSALGRQLADVYEDARSDIRRCA